MNVGMYRGMEAMAASEHRLAVLTGNLSNTDTVGFKRVTSVSHGEPNTGGNEEHAVVKTKVALDWSQGPLNRTGVATDLALRGDGFFAVESQGSETGEVFTRDGQFQVDPNGTLVTKDGFPVAWEGARGTLDPYGEPMRVELDGAVHQGDKRVGRLRIVDIPARDELDTNVDGYFTASAALSIDPSASEVHQYALEGSNTSSVEELVRLIETQRFFEAGSNIVNMIGQTYERLAQAGA